MVAVNAEMMLVYNVQVWYCPGKDMHVTNMLSPAYPKDIRKANATEFGPTRHRVVFQFLSLVLQEIEGTAGQVDVMQQHWQRISTRWN